MARRLPLIQAAFSVTALAAAVWWALRQRAPHLPGTTSSIAWLALAVLLYAVGTALRAERWRRILHLSEMPVSRGDAYGLTTVCYMGNNLLPARAGEMLRVFLLNRERGHGVRKVTGTIVAERILDALVLGVVLVAVVYGVLPGRVLPTNRPLLLVAAAVLLLSVGAGLVRLAGRKGLGRRVRDLARPIADAPRTLLTPQAIPLVAITILIWSLEAAVFACCGQAIGLGLSAIQALYLVALANLVTALPAAPGSIGTFDAAVVFGLTAIAKGGQAASGLLLLRLVLYAPITLVGLIVLFTRYGGWRLIRARRQPTEREPAERQALEAPAAVRA